MTEANKVNDILAILGRNIKRARLRRNISSANVAFSAEISRTTLVKIETGKKGVKIDAYIKVLSVLGLEEDMAQVAQADINGRTLVDQALDKRQRVKRISI